MDTLQVELGARSYPIHIGRELPDEAFAAAVAGRDCVCVVDANVAALHAERIERRFPGRPRLVVPAGEGSKSLAELERLATELLATGLGRDGLVVAIGGGVTGDLAGLLAATYLRGVPFVQVPTTLLAQLDASVGGKVAVNLPGAKNSVGCFHQPDAVLVELSVLDTLPRRELAAGLAEAVKMAAILDADLLARIEAEGASLLDPAGGVLAAVVRRCCELKASVVAEDEREAGRREILNFGHTFAHAVEGLRPGEVLHGEAVAMGMVFALELGQLMGLGPERARHRLEGALAAIGLPRRAPEGAGPRDLRAVMETDKKRRRGALRFVLLEQWGRARHGVEVDSARLDEALQFISS